MAIKIAQWAGVHALHARDPYLSLHITWSPKYLSEQPFFPHPQPIARNSPLALLGKRTSSNLTQAFKVKIYIYSFSFGTAFWEKWRMRIFKHISLIYSELWASIIFKLFYKRMYSQGVLKKLWQSRVRGGAIMLLLHWFLKEEFIFSCCFYTYFLIMFKIRNFTVTLIDNFLKLMTWKKNVCNLFCNFLFTFM